eukprot:611689-Prymnesium_polylepis.1
MPRLLAPWQDMSSLFREELAKDNEVQSVFAEYREKLRFYYNEATLLTSTKGKQENKVSEGRRTQRSRDRLAIRVPSMGVPQPRCGSSTSSSTTRCAAL